MRTLLLLIIFLLACHQKNAEPTPDPTPKKTKQDHTQASKLIKETTYTNTKTTHHVRMETVYYLTGPQQARPPEGRLQAGTGCRVIGDNGSYLQVTTDKGLTAWVHKDSLTPIHTP